MSRSSAVAAHPAQDTDRSVVLSPPPPPTPWPLSRGLHSLVRLATDTDGLVHLSPASPLPVAVHHRCVAPSDQRPHPLHRAARSTAPARAPEGEQCCSMDRPP